MFEGCDCVVTTAPDGVVCVVCVVVVIGVAVVIIVPAATVGGGGGGAETICESGSDAQPAITAITPHKVRSGVNDIERFF